MRASAFYLPYKDGNIAREQGARPRLLWHIGECKQGGGACRFYYRTPDGLSGGLRLLEGSTASSSEIRFVDFNCVTSDQISSK